MDSVGPQNGWLLLPEAAAAIGVSIPTLRRRIKAGQVESRLVPSPYGNAYQVRVTAYVEQPPSLPIVELDIEAPSTDQPLSARSAAESPQSKQPDSMTVDEASAGSLPTQDDHPPALLEALHMIREQQHQLIQLAGQVGYLQAQVQQRDDTIRALQAAPTIDASEADNATPAEVQDGPTSGPPPTRHPWWHFWSRG